MRKIPKEWLLLIVIAILVVIIGIFQWNQTKPVNQNSNEEGDVTVLVEYLPEKSNDNNMVFQFVLDTHSVNLDAFDFQKDVKLEKDNKESYPITVNQSGSGHHRKAEITFAPVAVPFTIIVASVSSIPRREFRFTNL